jgi:hypothetical protein
MSHITAAVVVVAITMATACTVSPADGPGGVGVPAVFVGKDSFVFVGDSIDLSQWIVGGSQQPTFEIVGPGGVVSMRGTWLRTLSPGVVVVKTLFAGESIGPFNGTRIGVMRDLRTGWSFAGACHGAGYTGLHTPNGTSADSVRSRLHFASTSNALYVDPTFTDGSFDGRPQFQPQQGLVASVLAHGVAVETLLVFGKLISTGASRTDTIVAQHDAYRMITTDTTGWLGVIYMGIGGVAVPPHIDVRIGTEAPIHARSTDSTALAFCGFASAQPGYGMFGDLLAAH